MGLFDFALVWGAFDLYFLISFFWLIIDVSFIGFLVTIIFFYIYIFTLISIVVAHFVYWFVTWLSFILYFLRLMLFLLSFVNCIPVHLGMCFWWYSFIITCWGYFVILEDCFFYICNVLFFSYTLLYLRFIGVFSWWYILYISYLYLIHTLLSLSL